MNPEIENNIVKALIKYEDAAGLSELGKSILDEFPNIMEKLMKVRLLK